MQTSPPSQRRLMSGPRRVASVPHRLSGRSPRPSIAPSPSASTEYGSGGGSVQNNIDLLFAHSAARIVSFNSATVLADQLLPWTSPTERTIASGPIRIYKTIPHDIAFLQSGSALRPVLSRSQCWNVDGRGVFCLQIRPGNFWRLEILEPEDGEAVKAIEFRGVLGKILAYEVTVCPFLRTGESCVREAEVLGVLQPSKVWRRPSRTASVDLGAVMEAPVVEKQCVVEEVGEDEQAQEIDLFGGFELTPKSKEFGQRVYTAPVDILPFEPVPVQNESSPSSVDFSGWQGFSTPRSFGVSRSCAAPPKLTDTNAFSTLTTPSTTPCPSPTKWHPAPSSPPQEIVVAKRRSRSSSLTSVGTEPTAYTEPSQGSPTPSAASTPTLWSGSDCQSEDNWSEVTTPPRRLFDPISTTTKPRLTRSASSIMLSGAAGLANVVVIRPSSYIAGLMFSIAAKIATRAVTGAAYSLTERMYSTDLAIPGLNDDEAFEYDDFGVCLNPAKVDSWEKDPWGVE